MKKSFILFGGIIFSFSSNIIAQQNVGIGTATPTEKLHVAGNVKVDTIKPNAIQFTPNAGNGKILTSNATGNASWAENSAVAGNLGYGGWGDCSTNFNIGEYLPVADNAGQKSDSLGSSVSVSAEFAFIGIPNADIGANTKQGAAIVYKYENSGWVYFAKLTDPAGDTDDQFGNSVYTNGNFAVIGSWNDDVGANSNQGSASIYQYNGTGWVFMQKITDAAGAALDRFGYSVSLSGNHLVVGAPFDDVGANTNQGSVSFFEYNGTNWALKIKLTDNNGSARDELGYSVAISGSNAIAGAPYADYQPGVAAPITDAGAVITYTFVSNNWIQGTKKINDGTEVNERFGQAVSLSTNSALIGEPGYSGGYGRARVYSFSGPVSLSLANESLLTKPSQEADDNFGYSVSISDQHMMVGIKDDDVGSNTNEGSASVFVKLGNNWQQLQFIADPSGSANNEMGASVSIDGATKRFLIGAPGAFGNKGKVLFGRVN